MKAVEKAIQALEHHIEMEGHTSLLQNMMTLHETYKKQAKMSCMDRGALQDLRVISQYSLFLMCRCMFWDFYISNIIMIFITTLLIMWVIHLFVYGAGVEYGIFHFQVLVRQGVAL